MPLKCTWWLKSQALTRLPWRLCGVSDKGNTSPSEGHSDNSELNMITLCLLYSTKCRTRERKLSLKEFNFHQPVNLDMSDWSVDTLWPKIIRFSVTLSCSPRCLEPMTWICWAYRPSVVYFQLTEDVHIPHSHHPREKLSPCCAKENSHFPVLAITVKSCWILGWLSGIITSTLLGLIRFTQKCWLSSRE